jgi:hypothetical protein
LAVGGIYSAKLKGSSIPATIPKRKFFDGWIIVREKLRREAQPSTQIINPLGRVTAMNYCVSWDWVKIKNWHPSRDEPWSRSRDDTRSA